MDNSYDILIIGGGLIGSSIAYHLARTGRGGRIVVVEPDPTYAQATTPRGSGGVRRLFSRPENVALASYGLEFYRTFDETMCVDGDAPDIGFKKQGYLFLSDNGGSERMIANHAAQTANGVDALLLERGDLQCRFPSLHLDDVAVGVLTPDDAWIDPHAALMGFRRKARSFGVEYVNERVVAWEMAGTGAGHVVCESGTRLHAEQFVLAAGAWSGAVAALIGWDVPIEPMSRQTHFFRCRTALEPLPFVKTETNLAFRPEGDGYTGGVPDWSVPSGFNWDYDPDWFENVVWPLLAKRVPAMSELRLERTWACHYERCLLDSNAIIGRWTGGLENVFIASGFSGHGIMQAPGAGLAIAELILDGRSSTLDVERLGYARVANNQPYPELGIV
jgi:FAD-dependent oxidoreductase domain-containing protein 1